MPNQLDAFPRFLLERCRYARSRGIQRFTVKHLNGDVIYVTLGAEGAIDAIRVPRVKVPGPAGKARMRLSTTEDQLQRDLLTGITSQQALDWRG